MQNFRTEYYIAQRISSSKKSRGVMERIASLTVAIGLCVMILSVAVIYGFRNQITEKLHFLSSDVKIVNLDSNNSLETFPIKNDSLLFNSIKSLEDVDFIAPYAVKGGIFRTSTAIQGVMLKGLDSNYNLKSLGNMLTEGELPRISDSSRYKDLLISSKLARMLGVKIGDRVEMMFIDEGQNPQRDRFAVSGIFETQMDQIDDYLAITDIRNVQKINRWEYDQITGYEIKSKGDLPLEEFTDKVFEQIRANSGSQDLLCLDLEDDFPMIFDWLKAHNVNGAVIITIMLIVALFNMISALLIILLERTSMIGVFKAMGMNNATLQRIFLIRSSYIVLRGMLWGNLVGLALCLIQAHTQIITLDAGGYFLSAVPIYLSLDWWLTLNIGAFVLICTVMFLPTKMILYIKPDITLRYK